MPTVDFKLHTHTGASKGFLAQEILSKAQRPSFESWNLTVQPNDVPRSDAAGAVVGSELVFESQNTVCVFVASQVDVRSITFTDGFVRELTSVCAPAAGLIVNVDLPEDSYTTISAFGLFEHLTMKGDDLHYPFASLDSHLDSLTVSNFVQVPYQVASAAEDALRRIATTQDRESLTEWAKRLAAEAAKLRD